MTKRTKQLLPETLAGIGGVSFSVVDRDAHLIRKIVDRAIAVGLKHGARFDRMSTQMDITACHANGNPLRLDDLLAADDFNFLHDIVGIERHLNRDTGKLMNCFSPRFTKQSKAA